MCFNVLIRLFGDDGHDDVEATFGSLSKKKEEEKPVCVIPFLNPTCFRGFLLLVLLFSVYRFVLLSGNLTGIDTQH